MSKRSFTRPHYRRIDEKFTNLIINNVKANPTLYLPNFERKTRELKEQIWSQFAQNYNFSVQDCKVRWKTIRDKYFKNRKLLQEGKTTRPYEYAHLLDFLNDIKAIQPRKKTSKNNDKPRIGSKKKPIEKRTLTVTSQEKTKEMSTTVEVPGHQSKFENRNAIFDATEVNVDMVVQILEMRRKEDLTTDNQTFSQLQDPENEEIPVEIRTNAEILTQVKNKMITFQVPKIKCLDKTVKSVFKPNICVPTEHASRTSNVATEEMMQIINNENKDIKQNKGLYKKKTHPDEHKKVTTQQLPNSDNKSCIESQYKDTEKILKEQTDSLNLNLETSKASTERYFDEMGEYVHNRFPKDKQQELKMKIWSLIEKNDTTK